MELSVRCFARYSEILGSHRVAVTIADDSTVADLIDALRLLPGGDLLPATVTVALGHRIAAKSTRVPQDLEVAILPPFAGG